jgi:GT2 family glycosyltransferase
MLTLVIGYRNRDVERVKRCLDSLARQTFKEFTLIFVDYGSPSAIAAAAKQTVERYPFTRYVYSDTRGWPWNRSRALNIGGRLAQSEYVVTTDVDVVFEKNVLEIVAHHLHRGRVLHCRPYFLPKDFSDWENLTSRLPSFRLGTEAMLGVFMGVPRKVFHELRGFDEYYRYWGVEDRDLAHRLKTVGVEQAWLPDEARMFHQWHPESNYVTADFMPDGAWRRMSIHFEQHKGSVTRNTECWGMIHRTEQRQVWQFVDPEAVALIKNDRLVMVDLQPDSEVSVSNVLRQLWQLPSGHALAVNHADYPGRTRWVDAIIRKVNAACVRLGSRARIDYRNNLLHAAISDCLFDCEEVIADYYLNIPASDGLTLVVRA